MTVKFGVIGTGIVGTTLSVKLVEAGYHLVGVNTRSQRSYDSFTGFLPGTRLTYQELVPQVDLLFITTQDDCIEQVARKLIEQELYRPGQVWIHCSGALDSTILKNNRQDLPYQCLSLHPLQAFANVATALDLIEGTHFGIEGDNPEFGERIVRDLGGIPHQVHGARKSLYHAGAVTASNYLVTLASLAVDFLHSAGIDREEALDSLLPLMHGTLKNLARTGLPDALTGPIARGDASIVKRHLEEMPSELHTPYAVLGSHTLKLAQAKWERKAQDYPEEIRQEIERLLRAYQ